MGDKIVIVGGGPVGLWTGIQIKNRRPKTKIIIYEKHLEYQRSHILKLDFFSLFCYAKFSKTISEKNFLNEVLGLNNYAQMACKIATGAHTYIRTQELEQSLKTHALNHGIEIRYSFVSCLEEIEKNHPETDFFIAADGAHSKMRKELLGENDVEKYPVQYVVELKTDVSGKHRTSKRDLVKINRASDSTILDFWGKPRQGISPLTLRFFTSRDIFNLIPETNFKHPLQLTDTRIPRSLISDLSYYQKIKGLRITEGSITKLVLALYRAKKFAEKSSGGNYWFLVGDAAMGVPYFRSLNSGLIVGSQLAYILTRRRTSLASKKRIYNACSPLDSLWEFTGAYTKDLGLNAFSWIRKVI